MLPAGGLVHKMPFYMLDHDHKHIKDKSSILNSLVFLLPLLCQFKWQGYLWVLKQVVPWVSRFLVWAQPLTGSPWRAPISHCTWKLKQNFWRALFPKLLFPHLQQGVRVGSRSETMLLLSFQIKDMFFLNIWRLDKCFICNLIIQVDNVRVLT